MSGLVLTLILMHEAVNQSGQLTRNAIQTVPAYQDCMRARTGLLTVENQRGQASLIYTEVRVPHGRIEFQSTKTNVTTDLHRAGPRAIPPVGRLTPWVAASRGTGLLARPLEARQAADPDAQSSRRETQLTNPTLKGYMMWVRAGRPVPRFGGGST